MNYQELHFSSAKKRLDDGVVIIFQEYDAMEFCDLLDFINTYKTYSNIDANSIPEIFWNDVISTPSDLQKYFTEFPPLRYPRMHLKIHIEITHQHHDFFALYVDHLECVIDPEETGELNEEHPLCALYIFFIDVEQTFSPVIEEMH